MFRFQLPSFIPEQRLCPLVVFKTQYFHKFSVTFWSPSTRSIQSNENIETADNIIPDVVNKTPRHNIKHHENNMI